MSSALRSAVPASFPAPTFTGATRRLRALPSLHVGAAALIVLVGGLLLAIATTSDPLWWQLHFSQLGIFGDLSSAFFNSTLKVSGMIVVVFAFCVRRDVARLGRGPVRRGAATVACICLNVVGVNLALVGCIPLNTDKDLHDRVAGSMVLGFLALLISAPIMFNRLGKRMAISTGIATVWLVVSIALFVTATINLALFETISCTAMFAWSGMFTHVLASAAAKATVRAEGAAVRHLAPRGIGRMVSSRAARTTTRATAPRSTAPRPTAARPTASRLTAPRPAASRLTAPRPGAARPTAPRLTAARPTAPTFPAGPLVARAGDASRPLLAPSHPVARLAGLGARSHTTAAPTRGDTAWAQGPASAICCADARPVDRADSSHAAGRTLALASSMRSTRPTRPGGRARPVSASRAARVGSAGDRLRRLSRPVRPSSTRVAPGAARSLLR